jgi:signal peptidase I
LSETAWLVKRIAAGPGDPVPTSVRAIVKVAVVPDGVVVLLGDNLRVSYDSRQAGFFPRERVLGRVAGARRVCRLDAGVYGGAEGFPAGPGNRPGRPT